jgi:hypothetical protein
MLDLLMRFLPADKRALLQLAMRMSDKLDTAEERQKVAEYGLAAFRNDGKISITEFTRLGKMMGILTAPKRRPAAVVSKAEE